MGIFQQFPYTNFHEMNLDEIIRIVKDMLDQWAQYYDVWDDWKEQVTQEWSEMQQFINDYFDNLDVQHEINTKINNMVTSGEFADIVDPFVPPAAAAWLAEHITQPTTPAIDTSLSVAGAAADAAAVGDRISIIENDINDIYPVIVPAGSMINGQCIASSTGDPAAASNAAATDFIEVIPNQDIKISNILVTGSRSICGYKDDQTFIAPIVYNSDITEITFKVPANVKYLRITAPINTEPVIRYTHVVQNVIDFLSVNNWNIIDNTLVTHQKIIDTDGSLINSANYYTLRFVPLEASTEYTTYAESAATAHKARRVAFYDSNNDLIGEVLNSPAEFTSPANAAYMGVSFQYITPAIQEIGEDYVALSNTPFSDILILNGKKIRDSDIISSNETINHDSYMPARRPIIGFIFDGEYNGNDDFKELFDVHSIKCGYAIPYNTTFSHVPTSTYLRWQTDGFDMLCHSAVAIGSQSTATDAEIKQIVIEAYETLTEYGFDLHGFVAYQGNARQIAIDTSEQFFDYAATQRNHSGSYTDPSLTESNLYFLDNDPYYLWRYSMNTSTLQQMKDAVDRCDSSKGLLLFYGHADINNLENMTIENIDALLTYIENKGISVLTPSEAVRNYYSIRYRDIVTP